MLESISELKNKLDPYKYLPKGEDVDVEAIVNALKNDPDGKYATLSEGELYQYAYGIVSQRQANILKYGLQAATCGLNNGKPNDPMWSQYTYQEIIAMEENGVLIPEDFLDWAHAMQDADTTSYQIETESEDSNTFENLEYDTESKSKSDIQKKAQAFASKAEAQEALTKNEIEKAKPLSAQVETKQNDISRQQQLSLDKMEDMKSEWTALDKKFQNGEALTDVEQKRYKELGTLLNAQQNDIIAKADSLSADIDDLLMQIDKVSNLVDTNNRIGDELKDVGLRLSTFEGGEKKAYLPNNKNTGLSGMQASFYFAAMGNNLSIETATINTRLYFDTMDVQHKLNADVALSEIAAKQSFEVKDVSKASEKDTSAQKQAQTQNPQGEEDIPLPPNQSAQPQTKAEQPDAAITNGQTASTDEAQSAAGADTTSETAPSTDTGETTPTTGAEDPLEAETRAYVEDCSSKNQDMLQAEEALQPIKEQVQQIKKNQKQEDAKLEKELKDALKEYNTLLKKVQSGNDLSKKEMTRFDQLGKLLSADNGKYIVQMQDKVDVLTGFSSELEKDINTTVENSQYGQQAVEKGKEYAKSVLGDREALLNAFWFTAMSKEQKYDFLYGKAGESAGRDAIDGGEILIANADASNVRLSESLPLASFATEYSGVLNEKIANTNKEVNTMNQDFDEAFKKNAEKKQSEGGAQANENTDEQPALSGGTDEGASSAKVASKEKDPKDVTKDDGAKIEEQGKSIEKEGKEIKKEGKEAKKEKASTDAQIKREKNALKRSENEIKKIDQESQKIQQEFAVLNAEAETINAEMADEAAQEEEASAADDEAQPAPVAAASVIENPPAVSMMKAVSAGNAYAAPPVISAAVSNQASISPVSRVSKPSTRTVASTPKKTVSTSSSNNSAQKTERLNVISQQIQGYQGTLDINGKKVTTIQKTSSKKVKKLDKLYTKRQKDYSVKIEDAENKNDERSKFQKDVSKAAKLFNMVTIAGLALMVVPWTAAIGLKMTAIGAYGTSACYVTNSAIEVANGNFGAALLNFGAAVVSFATAGVSAGAALGGVVNVSTKAAVNQAVTGAMVAGFQAGNYALQNAANKPYEDKAADEDNNTKKNRKFVSYQTKKKRKTQLAKIQKSTKVGFNTKGSYA